jgi:hypothetical protein
MKVTAIILWSFFVQCLLCSIASSEYSPCFDPNYIDNPGVLHNGLFECGEPNLVTQSFTPPIYWERIPLPDTLADCYAGLHPDFVPPEPRIEWVIPGPYQGDTFVVLSTGGYDAVPDGAVTSSKISEEVFLYAGDTIIGAYFFGTTDYRPFNDYASIFLELAVDPNDYPDSVEHVLISGAQCDVETIESFRSTFELSPETGGWITFSHTPSITLILQSMVYVFAGAANLSPIWIGIVMSIFWTIRSFLKHGLLSARTLISMSPIFPATRMIILHLSQTLTSPVS